MQDSKSAFDAAAGAQTLLAINQNPSSPATPAREDAASTAAAETEAPSLQIAPAMTQAPETQASQEKQALPETQAMPEETQAYPELPAAVATVPPTAAPGNAAVVASGSAAARAAKGKTSVLKGGTAAKRGNAQGVAAAASKLPKAPPAAANTRKRARESVGYFENGDLISEVFAEPDESSPARKVIPDVWGDHISDPEFAHEFGESKNEDGTLVYPRLRSVHADLDGIQHCAGLLRCSRISPNPRLPSMRSGNRWLPQRLDRLRKELKGAFVGVAGDLLQIKRVNARDIEKLLLPQLPGAVTYFILQSDSDVANALKLAASDKFNCRDVVFFSLEGRRAQFDAISKQPWRCTWSGVE